MKKVARLGLTDLLCMGDIKKIGLYTAKPQGKLNHNLQTQTGQQWSGMVQAITKWFIFISEKDCSA